MGCQEDDVGIREGNRFFLYLKLLGRQGAYELEIYLHFICNQETEKT